MKLIEPLVESEPLVLIWSVNEIIDFRNHINDFKDIYYKNLVRDEIPSSLMRSYKSAFESFESSILLTDQIEPSVSDSTSGAIGSTSSSLSS